MCFTILSASHESHTPQINHSCPSTLQLFNLSSGIISDIFTTGIIMLNNILKKTLPFSIATNSNRKQRTCYRHYKSLVMFAHKYSSNQHPIYRQRRKYTQIISNMIQLNVLAFISKVWVHVPVTSVLRLLLKICSSASQRRGHFCPTRTNCNSFLFYTLLLLDIHICSLKHQRYQKI